MKSLLLTRGSRLLHDNMIIEQRKIVNSQYGVNAFKEVLLMMGHFLQFRLI